MLETIKRVRLERKILKSKLSNIQKIEDIRVETPTEKSNVLYEKLPMRESIDQENSAFRAAGHENLAGSISNCAITSNKKTNFALMRI